LLPSEISDHRVPGLELGIVRFDDLAGGPADHHLPDVHIGRVRLHIVHAAAHIRIEREVKIFYQHLAGTGLRDISLDDFEVGYLDPSNRTAGERHLNILLLMLLLAHESRT